MALVDPSDWDTGHFGFKVARLRTETVAELDKAEAICRQQGIKLLISRFDAGNIDFAHNLEERGFELMDAVVRYRLKLSETRGGDSATPATIRPFQQSEANDVAEIARVVYKDHFDHFHHDPRLDRKKCDDLYARWASNSCLDKNMADIALVAEMEGKVVGFHSHKIIEPRGVGGVISGVSRTAQGKGIGKALIVATIAWCQSQGMAWIEEYPHINNYAMHRLMAALGFKLCGSSYTFHKWFDEVK